MLILVLAGLVRGEGSWGFRGIEDALGSFRLKSLSCLPIYQSLEEEPLACNNA